MQNLLKEKVTMKKVNSYLVQFLSTDLIQRLLACTFLLQLEQKLTDSILINSIV